MARTKRKRSGEINDSGSNDEASDLDTDSKTSRKQLAEIDVLQVTLGNLAKLTDVKLQLLEAKVDKLQANVSVMHSRSMQGTPPIGIFYPSVVPDRSNPPASSAPTSDTKSNFYAMWKG